MFTVRWRLQRLCRSAQQRGATTFCKTLRAAKQRLCVWRVAICREWRTCIWLEEMTFENGFFFCFSRETRLVASSLVVRVRFFVVVVVKWAILLSEKMQPGDLWMGLSQLFTLHFYTAVYFCARSYIYRWLNFWFNEIGFFSDNFFSFQLIYWSSRHYVHGQWRDTFILLKNFSWIIDTVLVKLILM